MQIELTINRESVWQEVAKTTNYTGAKMEGGDEATFDRIATTDEDQQLLERFWAEACNTVSDQLKPFIVAVNGINNSGTFAVVLEMSSAFDSRLRESINTSLFSYFVAAIVAKWYGFTNKGEASQYAEMSASMMDDVMRKIYYKKRPTRVAPNIN
jgi:hypothetical protein